MVFRDLYCSLAALLLDVEVAQLDLLSGVRSDCLAYNVPFLSVRFHQSQQRRVVARIPLDVLLESSRVLVRLDVVEEEGLQLRLRLARKRVCHQVPHHLLLRVQVRFGELLELPDVFFRPFAWCLFHESIWCGKINIKTKEPSVIFHIVTI